MKWDKSRELYERAKESMAGGIGGSSTRLADYPHPLFFERGKGSKLCDVDGNEYIDYALGRGPVIFGHAPDFLLENVARRLEMGQVFGAQHELEIKVSEMLQSIVPCAELVRYASSGTEAVQVALRVARAYTGRSRFVKFEGMFHGWADSVAYRHAEAPLRASGPYEAPVPVPESAGVAPSTAEDIIVVPFNDIEVLRKALDNNHNEVAAIIVEPGHYCVMPEAGYIQGVRRLCDERGVVLIFDEVITGFRVALGGAQEVMGVTPDLATFAKAVAGGFPLSVIAGKREMMALMEDGTVMHGGTVNSNIMSMAAAEASLEKLMEDDGAVYRQLTASGTALRDGLRELAQKHEMDVLLQGPGPLFFMGFTDAPEVRDWRSNQEYVDAEKGERFWTGMMERGVRKMPGTDWYLSTAHTEEDIEQTLRAADEVFATL